jgi:hypothetical protein
MYTKLVQRYDALRVAFRESTTMRTISIITSHGRQNTGASVAKGEALSRSSHTTEAEHHTWAVGYHRSGIK